MIAQNVEKAVSTLVGLLDTDNERIKADRPFWLELDAINGLWVLIGNRYT